MDSAAILVAITRVEFRLEALETKLDKLIELGNRVPEPFFAESWASDEEIAMKQSLARFTEGGD